MARLDVIDLSHHNSVSSFAAVKSQGIVGVIHKCTEGRSIVDKMYESRKAHALAAGLKWSSYHFLRPGDMQGQMVHYVNIAKPVHGERMCLDYEISAVSINDLCAAVQFLLDIGRNLQITIYSGHLLKEKLGDARNEFLRANTSLWVAQYTTESPTWPTGTYATWSLWQYSDGSVGGTPRNVAGVTLPVDCNMFNGSRENLEKWFGPAGVEESSVHIEITTKGAAKVFVSVDGNPLPDTFSTAFNLGDE